MSCTCKRSMIRQEKDSKKDSDNTLSNDRKKRCRASIGFLRRENAIALFISLLFIKCHKHSETMSPSYHFIDTLNIGFRCDSDQERYLELVILHVCRMYHIVNNTGFWRSLQWEIDANRKQELRALHHTHSSPEKCSSYFPKNVAFSHSPMVFYSIL